MANSAFNRSQLTYPQAIKNICDFRLTLVTGTPIMTSSQTGVTTVYMTPYKGNEISLYDGTNWQLYTTGEISLSLAGLTASKNYDIWCYNNGGTPTLEALVWTNDTTRATALTTQDGVYVKTGATTRRYIGTIRINSSGGQCDYIFGAAGASGTAGDLGVWNYYNRVLVKTIVADTTNSWTYATNTFRAANGSATNRVSFLCGVQEDSLSAIYYAEASSSATSTSGWSGVGVDSTTVASGVTGIFNSTTALVLPAYYGNTIAVGYHFTSALEKATGATITYYGDNGGGNVLQSGLAFEFLM